MRQSLVLIAAAAVACCSEQTHALRTAGAAKDIRSAPLVSRRVDGYNYLDDVSGYNMIFGKCIRVKVKSNNDDDAEGNSYFVNGRYHAQYTNYASFYLCDDGGDSVSCNSCDYSTEYVTDLNTFIEESTSYIQGMCNACSAYCRRRLEDEDEDGGGDGDYNYNSLDCSTCKKQCSNLSANNGGADETQYLECQEAVEENDIQYYSAPQCGSDNGIIIGLYYDEDCTVKTSQELDYGFSYDTFQLIEETCIDCNDGLCAELYDDALHCVDGYNKNGNADDGDMPVCKTAKSMADRTFAKRRKQLKFMPFVILAVILAALLLFGSYTYYVRHKNPLAQPLSSADGQQYLPPIT